MGGRSPERRTCCRLRLRGLAAAGQPARPVPSREYDNRAAHVQIRFDSFTEGHYLEPDRLLYQFNQVAGLPTTAEPYGGWESPTYVNGLINGHFTGHLLSATAFSIAAGVARSASASLHRGNGVDAACVHRRPGVRTLNSVDRCADDLMLPFTR